MTTKTISLNTIVDVKEFVNIVARYDFEVDLVSGRYHIDGKSIHIKTKRGVVVLRRLRFFVSPLFLLLAGTCRKR